MLVAYCVLAAEPQQQDQEGAEQFYHIHGFYPSWYPALGAVRVYPYAYGHYNYYGAYPYGVIPGAQPTYGSLPQHVKANGMMKIILSIKCNCIINSHSHGGQTGSSGKPNPCWS